MSNGNDSHPIARILTKLQEIYPFAKPVNQLVGSTEFQNRIFDASNFGLSLGGALLYAQCGDSSLRSPGLVVMGPGYTFGIGLYEVEGTINAHLIAPSGSQWVAGVLEFTKWLLRNGSDRVYVRFLPIESSQNLPARLFLDPSDQYRWCPKAPYEDETYCHRLIDLEEIVEVTQDGFKIQPLVVNGSKNFRNKFRHAHSRFENFLSRNQLKYELVCLSQPAQLWSYKSIVDRHFSHLREHGRAVGSTSLDYEQMLRFFPCNSERSIAFVGQLINSSQKCLPVSLFLGEFTSPSSGGLYCTITDRDENLVRREFHLIDTQGLTAIGQYAYGQIFAKLRSLGWKHVDLGGSETKELDRFKQQIGCKEHKTVWRVCTHNQLAYFDASMHET